MRRYRSMAKVAFIGLMLMFFTGQVLASNIEQAPVSSCKLESVTADVRLDYDPALCGSLATLTAFLTGGKGPFAFQWYDGTVPLGDSNPLLVVLPPGDHSVHVVVTDTATVDCTITSAAVAVSAADQYPPAVSCPPGMAASTDPGQCTGHVDLNVSASDNCGGVSLAYFSGNTEIDSSYRFPVGVTPVQVVATDRNGLVNDVCTFAVTIDDAEQPSITCPAPAIVPSDAGACTATNVNLGTPTYGDNCPGVALSNNAPSQYPYGDTIVTWTATDARGGTASCQQKVTVVDSGEPRITCPANITVSAPQDQCQAAVNVGQPVVTDQCSSATAAGVRNDGRPLGDPYPAGVTTITWTATDAASNEASCHQTVTVSDNQAPTVICPANIMTSVEVGKCDALVTFEASARDSCGVAPVEYYVGNNKIGNSARFPAGTTIVTAKATDGQGNSSTCNFAVTVNDPYAPSVMCRTDIAVANDAGQCSASVPFEVGATDNCGLASVKYYVGQDEIRSPHTFPVGATTVDVVAQDAQGNASRCSFKVTINDTEAPTIACPADIAQGTDRGVCSAAVNIERPSVADNCAVAEIASWRSDGKLLADLYPVGVTSITWMVTDIHQNEITCTQTITIEDQSPAAIHIEKHGPAVAANGAIVTYSFAVTNDDVLGDGAPIAQVQVVDDLAGPATYESGDDGDEMLEVGETWTFSAPYRVRADDPKELTNIATATGLDCDGHTISAQASHTIKVARAVLEQPHDSSDPLCAGWRQRYTVSFTNTGAVELVGVTLAAQIPANASFDMSTSSEGLVEDDATHAHWDIQALQPGEVVELDLGVRASTTMAGEILTTCFTLDAERIDPIAHCEDSQVIRCEGPTPTLQPTRTPTVTPTVTPTPTGFPPIYLPLFRKGSGA